MFRKIVTPIVILLIVLSFMLHGYWKSKKEVSQLQRDYPSIAYNRKLNLSIQKIFNPESLRNSPNHAFVTFSNSEQATIETTHELKTGTLTLDDVLSAGDSIVKEANSNVILVYKPTGHNSRDAQPFRFRLWQFRDTE